MVNRASADRKSVDLIAQLVRPSMGYRLRTLASALCALLFLAAYAALTAWLLHTAWRLALRAPHPSVWTFLAAAVAALLAVFLLKGLVSLFHKPQEAGRIQVTAKEEPMLFEFLHTLADRAGAPRPRRVFLSARVNASVRSRLSLLGLLLPGPKDLEIGLGLVNVLGLGELRAVLAHEFGHFAQRTTTLGRWTYVTQQIAAELVARRDWLDEILHSVCRADPRIAWFGWLVSVLVWAIRALVDGAFRGLTLLHRALSRDMELQADLVAVALTGSDALVHALYKLRVADDAWDLTCAFMARELTSARATADAFTIHTRLVEHLRELVDDPRYSPLPPVPAQAARLHRVFTPELAEPPRMWQTHPTNSVREDNAKRRYVAATISQRSPWELFADPQATRRAVTATLFDGTAGAPVPIEASLASLAEQFTAEPMQPRYRGVYSGRSPVRAAATIDELIVPVDDAPAALATLYSDAVQRDVCLRRTATEELMQLRALYDGALEPAGGVIRFRGEELARSALPRTIKKVAAELDAVEERLTAHDRLCRSTHLALATSVGGGWHEYLRGALAALHYAEHTSGLLELGRAMLGRVVVTAAADGAVSSAARQRILAAGHLVVRLLTRVRNEREQVRLDPELLAAAGLQDWSHAVGNFHVTGNTAELGGWLRSIERAAQPAAVACTALRSAALRVLLRAEARVADAVRAGAALAPAPAPAAVPESYDVLPSMVHATSDPSARPTLDGVMRRTHPAVRLTAAAALVVGLLVAGESFGSVTVVLHNGLATPVTVHVGQQSVDLGPQSVDRLTVPADAPYTVRTVTRSGELVETFEERAGADYGNWVYNVAGASALFDAIVVYGPAHARFGPPGEIPRGFRGSDTRDGTPPPRSLGAPRWLGTAAQFVFVRPPEQLELGRYEDARRHVLGAMDSAPVETQLAALVDPGERHRMVTMHARWDDTQLPGTQAWLAAAAGQPEFVQIISARLATAPEDVVLLRALQDGTTGERHEAVCAAHREQSVARPDNANLRYLAVRTMANHASQADAFLAGHRRWPQHGWFAFAAGNVLADRSDWDPAIRALQDAHRALPPLRDVIEIKLLRLRRFLPKRVGPGTGQRSEAVEAAMAIESDREAAMHEYAELNLGDIKAALDAAGAEPARAARLLRLAAASVGADADLAWRAFNLPPHLGLDECTAWAMLALSLREGCDPQCYLAVAPPVVVEAWPGVRAFLDQAAIDAAAAAPLAAALPLEQRAQAYAMAVVIMGRKAPNTWRAAARALLFAFERPYVG